MTAKPKSLEPRSPKPDLSSNAEERIRRRAHELYEQRGRVDGFALDDWLQAEIEILGKQKGRIPDLISPIVGYRVWTWGRVEVALRGVVASRPVAGGEMQGFCRRWSRQDKRMMSTTHQMRIAPAASTL